MIPTLTLILTLDLTRALTLTPSLSLTLTLTLGVIRREVAGCHHFTILATPGFVAAFVEAACATAQ